MTKNQAIRQINRASGFNRLNSQNTHWSNVVKYGSNEGWWLNIPFKKFSQDLNLILNNENTGIFIHIRIPANTIKNAITIFRDKDDAADIFIPNAGSNYLIDCQSGSARHNFKNYNLKEYKHDLGIDE